MTYTALKEAIAEAERFLERAKTSRDYVNAFRLDHEYIGADPRHAATKRASMDLTKALAKMRRSS